MGKYPTAKQPQQLAEVETRRTADQVQGVTDATMQKTSVQTMIRLQMADHRFNRTATPFSFALQSTQARVARTCEMNFRIALVIVAAITFVDIRFGNRNACDFFRAGD
jgi:hypothetical protein